MLKSIKLIVNNKEYMVDVKPFWSLAYVLREKLSLTGTKIGCGKGQCGTCTVILDELPIFSCLKLAIQAEGQNIITIEGLLSNEGKLDLIQKSFIDNHGMQCGFCSSGMIMAAKTLLNKDTDPAEEDVREVIGGHICRCGTYPRIVKSILEAAKEVRAGG